MNRSYLLLIAGLFLTLSVFAAVSGEDTPISRVSVSGNASNISAGSNGTYQIILDQVDPNASVVITNKTVEISLKEVLPVTTCTAAIIPSGPDGNKSVFMVQVSDPLYSTENHTISWTITPQKYYEGTLLTEYSENQSELQPGEYSATVVYLECRIPELENRCHLIYRAGYGTQCIYIGPG